MLFSLASGQVASKWALRVCLNMDSNPTPDTTILVFVCGVRHHRISHGTSCRESPEKRFEFVFFADQFGVVAEFFLIKLQLPTSPSVLARNGFRQAPHSRIPRDS
jgi:hypothetical protein